MSAGRSFHSVWGRAFWKEREEALPAGEGERVVGERRGGGASLPFDGAAATGVADGGAALIGGRLTAATRTGCDTGPEGGVTAVVFDTLSGA